MRKFRFKTERHNLRPGSSVLLTDFEAEHAHRVLRLKKGDEIYLFNGIKEYRAELKLVSKDAVMAKIIEETSNTLSAHSRGVEYTLFLGMPKIKSFELILEKASELGVTNIVPILSEYSVIKEESFEKKIQRWEKIMLTACKQSERVDVPELSAPVSFSDGVEHALNEIDANYIFSLPRDSKYSFTDLKNIEINKEHQSVGIFIGPEGGFSPNEHELSIEKGLHLTTLFPEILRTETAVISALSVLRFLYE